MATATASLFIANDTQAHFNAWVQWMHDQLAAFGLVQTADTGQLANPIVAPVPASGAPAGYEIWRLNDALQATKPLYIKIEYGNGSTPGVWLTIGTGANGAGQITGVVSSRLSVWTNQFTTASVNCYASGSANRFAFAFGCDPIQNQSNPSGMFYFGVERIKNADGTDSIEGAVVHIFSYNTTFGSSFQTQAMPFVGSVPAIEPFGTGDMPTSGQTSGVFGTDVYTYAIRPALGFPHNPMMNWCVYFNADFARETPVTLDVYGANHVYLPLGNAGPPANSSAISQRSNANARIMMRWE